MQNQGAFKLCASSTDIVKRFAVIKSVIINRVNRTSNSSKEIVAREYTSIPHVNLKKILY